MDIIVAYFVFLDVKEYDMRRIVCQFSNDTSFNDVLVHSFVCRNKVLKMYFEFVCYSNVCMLARD